MKQYSTNYFNTFIEVAADCSATIGEIPPEKEPKTAARIEYDMVANNPYQYSSDDVLYESNGNRRGINRETFFSKGQPCFRSSALTKRYGWGVHSNSDGKIAIFAVDSDEYTRLADDDTIKHLKGMRSSKKQQNLLSRCGYGKLSYLETANLAITISFRIDI